jgi:cysteine desulfurase
LIVGLGHAAALAGPEREDEADRIGRLRDKLEQQLRLRLDHTTINGHPTARLPGNLNMSFGNVEGEALMMTMREVAVSSGSACSAADPEPSHVLRAMGLDEDLARSSLRFGLGRFTTEEEIDFAIERTVWAVERLRTLHRG